MKFNNKRQKPRVLPLISMKLCIIIAATFIGVILPQPVRAANEDNKSGDTVADSTGNITNDQKDRDRLTSVSPFPDNTAPLDYNKTQTAGADGSPFSNISTITNNSSGNDTKEVQSTTTTTSTAAPLIPPATVNAAIAQMNSSSNSKKKGQIIIR